MSKYYHYTVFSLGLGYFRQYIAVKMLDYTRKNLPEVVSRNKVEKNVRSDSAPSPQYRFTVGYFMLKNLSHAWECSISFAISILLSFSRASVELSILWANHSLSASVWKHSVVITSYMQYLNHFKLGIAPIW